MTISCTMEESTLIRYIIYVTTGLYVLVLGTCRLPCKLVLVLLAAETVGVHGQ